MNEVKERGGPRVRYVHVKPGEMHHFAGTIAYIADWTTQELRFAWADLNPNDRFVKKEGRDMATPRLEAPYFQPDNQDHKCGKLTKRELIDGFSDAMEFQVFSKSVTDNLGVESFRHAALSNLLANLVNSHNYDKIING